MPKSKADVQAAPKPPMKEATLSRNLSLLILTGGLSRWVFG